jgi:hypothetical protein
MHWGFSRRETVLFAVCLALASLLVIWGVQACFDACRTGADAAAVGAAGSANSDVMREPLTPTRRIRLMGRATPRD